MNISDAETTNVKASNTEILKIVLRDCTFILPPFFVPVIYYKTNIVSLTRRINNLLFQK